MIIIVSSDTPARHIAIVAPERRECAPTYMGPKPNFPLPWIWAAAHNVFFEFLLMLLQNFFLSYIWKCLPDFLYVGRCRCMIGLMSRFLPTVGLCGNTGDLICTCWNIYFDNQLFWYSKVILIQSAFYMSWSCRKYDFPVEAGVFKCDDIWYFAFRYCWRLGILSGFHL